jgi:hypothetical protein
VESLIEHPALMTHASIPAEQRARLGIGEGLIGCQSASRMSKACGRTCDLPWTISGLACQESGVQRTSVMRLYALRSTT